MKKKGIELDEEWKEVRGYQQKVFGFEGLYFLKKGTLFNLFKIFFLNPSRE